MEQLIYIDTNVWIDFWEDRRDNIRPLGEFAFQLLKRVYECKFRVVLSSAVLKEIYLNYPKDIADSIFKDLRACGKYIEVSYDMQDSSKAELLSEKYSLPYNDCLHAVLANKAGAKYIVTRNIKHFENLAGLAEPKLPEELP